MTICYDHQTFTDQEFGGISRYFTELIKGINESSDSKATVAIRRTNNAYLREYNPSIPSFFPNTYIPKKNVLLRLINKAHSARVLKNNTFDVYHPTNYNIDFLKFTKKPVVVTFYDMIHEKIGRTNELANNTTITDYKRIMANCADRLIAISESTKIDMVNLLNIPAEKISVIHLGSSMPIVEPLIMLPTAQERPYLLFVGTRRHYKNFIPFIKAIAELLKAYDIDLLCAGGPNFQPEELESIHQLQIGQHVFHKEITNDNQLAQYYQKAIAFVFPSLLEGFGIPILEAMSCGCPCVLSNTSSLPEVAGEAAVYFEPSEPTSIKSAVQQLLDNAVLRNQLSVQGHERVALFSWQKTVHQTLNVYKALVA